VFQGVEEVADGAHLDKGRMGAWSTASLVSRSDKEARPERARESARSSGSCVVESLRGNGWEKDHQVRRSEANGGRSKRGRGLTDGRRFLRKPGGSTAAPTNDYDGLAAQSGEGKRGKRRGG
jgi:hypothetical protein